MRGAGTPPQSPSAKIVIHPLQMPLVVGLSCARNDALAHARAQGLLGAVDVVAFPDDDCRYPDGLLARVAALIDADTEIVGGPYGPSADEVDHRRFPSEDMPFSSALAMRAISSNNVFFAARVVAAVGDFDERFGLGARYGASEDSDYVLRALRLGVGGAYRPREVFIEHPYKAHRPSQYYVGNVAVEAKHALGGGTCLQLARRLASGLVLVLRRTLTPRDYLRAVWAAGRLLAGSLGIPWVCKGAEMRLKQAPSRGTQAQDRCGRGAPTTSALNVLRDFAHHLRDRVLPGSPKHESEMRYWRERALAEGVIRDGVLQNASLDNSHYERVFTAHFGLTTDFFASKRILDIGCGPRGSLEWAATAADRVGLDPLADDYRDFGIHRHAMRYLTAPAENMPFEAASFDIVTLLNSLDHVGDIPRTIAEVSRVAVDGGTLLLTVEVRRQPTATEPHWLDWDIVDQFSDWTVAWSARNAVRRDHNLYRSVDEDRRYRSGHGLLRARLVRNPR